MVYHSVLYIYIYNVYYRYTVCSEQAEIVAEMMKRATNADDYVLDLAYHWLPAQYIDVANLNTK